MAETNNTSLALVDPESNEVMAMDGYARECQMVKADRENPIATGLKMANGMAKLRLAFTDQIMAGVMSLQGSSIGFKTDKDSAGGYPMPVVRDCTIEALARGLNMIGNEFNILQGRMYITKEGYGALLNKIPGLKYMTTPSIPSITPNGAEAKVLVEWKYNGESNSQVYTCAVKVNAGMGADAINGKATRKARAWLYSRITGFETPDGDVDDVVSSGQGKTATVTSRFAKKTEQRESDIIIDNTETITVQEEPTKPATPEEQYPTLASKLTSDNIPLKVQDFIEWYDANKMTMNEKAILEHYQKACEGCVAFVEAKAIQNN